MRVQLRTDRQNGDEGAVALVVALLSVVLLLMAAFAVDLGNAYAVKRQLSVAADASALDAARAVAVAKSGGLPILGGGQGCDNWNPPEIAAAQQAAEDAAEATNATNDISGDSRVNKVTVTCVGDERVDVQVDNSRDLPVFFGGIADITGIEPSRSATAAVTPRLSIGGLRPFAVCDLIVDQAQTQPGTTFAIDISNQRGVCSGSSSGNWGLADFNGPTGGASCSETSTWTETGYPDPVLAPDSNLYTKPGNCLNSLRTELSRILDKVVLFPVVSGYSDPGGGRTARFDLVGFVAAKVCGYSARSFTVSGSCYDSLLAAPYLSARPQEEFIQFRYVDYTTGYSGGGSTCSFTDPKCKYAILAAQLYK